jgi:hypothetical protein
MNKSVIEPEIADAASYRIRVYSLDNPLSWTEADDLRTECSEYANDKKDEYDPNNKEGATLYTWACTVIDNHLSNLKTRQQNLKRTCKKIEASGRPDSPEKRMMRYRVMKILSFLSKDSRTLCEGFIDSEKHVPSWASGAPKDWPSAKVTRRTKRAKREFIKIWLKLYGESPFPQWDERQAKAKKKGQN